LVSSVSLHDEQSDLSTLTPLRLQTLFEPIRESRRVESWVKGGTSKGEPTIITPVQYKTRFRQAMESYFLLVPDIWCDHSVLLPINEANTKSSNDERYNDLQEAGNKPE